MNCIGFFHFMMLQTGCLSHYLSVKNGKKRQIMVENRVSKGFHLLKLDKEHVSTIYEKNDRIHL